MNPNLKSQYLKVLLGIALFGSVAWYFESFDSGNSGAPLYSVKQSRNTAAVEPKMSCSDSLMSVVNTSKDASSILQHCLDGVPLAGTLELPAGVFMLENQVRVSRAVTIKTKARDVTSAPCSVDDRQCAELRAASAFNSAQPQGGGLVFVVASNVLVDHLIINGNKMGRMDSGDARECRSGNNYRGFNMSFIDNSSSRFQNGVSQNALCGTGFQVGGKTRDIKILNNTFAFNGVHDQNNLWSDGLTEAGESFGSSFIGNHFVNNSDVDLIFGSCQNCEISRNTIDHNSALAGGSYAAMMIQAWPKNKDGSGGTSGNHSNSQFHSNTIDCGPKKRCGFGIYVGQQAWYDAQVSFGSVHDNIIKNAQLGLNIDQSMGVTLYNNSVLNSGGSFRTSCGVRNMLEFNIGSSVTGLDTSQNKIPMKRISNNTWANNCIPNMLDLKLIEKVRDTYLTLLARSPDDSGEDEYYQQLLAKKSMRTILLSIIQSAEFKNARPVEAKAFVTFLYQRLLNRPPDKDGLASHLAALPLESREKMILSFFDSAEFQEKHPLLTK